MSKPKCTCDEESPGRLECAIHGDISKRTCAVGYDCDACKGIEGMTLRDWFAGMAMIGTLSNCAACINAETGEQTNKTPSLVANFAYQYSDAMLKERMK